MGPVSIISIQLVNSLSAYLNAQYIYLVLAAGPVLGLIALLEKADFHTE